MKLKLLAALAALVCAVAVMAEPLVIPVTVTTTATQAVYTNVVDVPQPTVGAIFGAAGPFRLLEKVVVKNNTLTNASVSVEMADLDDWTTLTGSPVTAATRAQGIGYPARLVAETIAGYVVTGDVPLAVTSTVTRPEPYWVQRVRLITTLTTATNASTLKLGLQFR